MIPQLETLGDVRIMVVGDLMLDEYFYGDVERVSPEAPVPVVHQRHHEKRVGGAGSVVTNLTALGAEVIVVGLVGDDESGRAILGALESVDANVDGVVVSCNVPTRGRIVPFWARNATGNGKQ